MALRTSQPLVALVILDGWGFRETTAGNAIALAHTPTFDTLWKQYPHALLKASGASVGLPEGIMGNSEVGHLTLGSGSITKQSSLLIDEALKDGSFGSHPLVHDAFTTLAKTKKRLHLIGLASDGLVHSNYHHFYSYLQLAQQARITQTFIHPFLDGRDAPPQSASIYLEKLEQICANASYGAIGSISGRFYAMDRDTHWERTCAVYHMLTTSTQVAAVSWQSTLNDFYSQGITDEFIPPTLLNSESIIQPQDGILFINFRADRARQLTQAFTAEDNPCKGTQVPLAFFIIPVSYGIEAPSLRAIIEKQLPTSTLLDLLDAAQLRIFSIAETEKYAHITYFFNGGREKQYEHEERVLIPSKRVVRHDQAPAMSAPEITASVINSLKSSPANFYLINYANADMVGHTGNLPATIQAIECLDAQLKRLYEEIVQKRGGILLITADHGNAEEMIDANGAPKTAHTTHVVPFIYVDTTPITPSIKDTLTELKDVAPFIRKLIFNKQS